MVQLLGQLQEGNDGSAQFELLQGAHMLCRLILHWLTRQL